MPSRRSRRRCCAVRYAHQPGSEQAEMNVEIALLRPEHAIWWLGGGIFLIGLAA